MENKKIPAKSTETMPAEIGQRKSSFLPLLIEKGKKLWLTFTAFMAVNMMSAVTAFASGTPSGGTSGGGSIDDQAGMDKFQELVEFFATWIGRIGLVVAFVGGVMFGLAIKNDDAEAKTRGLMTFASGIVVFALTQAISFFMN